MRFSNRMYKSCDDIIMGVIISALSHYTKCQAMWPRRMPRMVALAMLPAHEDELSRVEALARFDIRLADRSPVLFLKTKSHSLKFLGREQTFALLFAQLPNTRHLLY